MGNYTGYVPQSQGTAGLTLGDSWIPGNRWFKPSDVFFNGICYQRSEVTISDVRDGTSYTYMVGEKSIDADHPLHTGDGRNVLAQTRSTNPTAPAISVAQDMPTQDSPGFEGAGFGSAHSSGFHALFCDGSVKMVSYSIDAVTHDQLANRDDGRVIDAKDF